MSPSHRYSKELVVPVVLPGKNNDLLNPFFCQTWTVLLSTHVTALTTHGGKIMRFMQVPLLSTEGALKTHGRKNKEDCAVWTSHAVYARTSIEYWKSFKLTAARTKKIAPCEFHTRLMHIPLLITERALKTYGGKNKEDCAAWISHAAYAHTSTEYWKSFNNLRREEQRKLPRVNLTRGRWNVTY